MVHFSDPFAEWEAAVAGEGPSLSRDGGESCDVAYVKEKEDYDEHEKCYPDGHVL